MKTKLTFVVLMLTLQTTFIKAQSDACSGAVNLPINTSCSSQSFSVPASFTDGGLVNASCVSNNDREDGWFTIVATSSSTTIQASADRRLILAAFTNCTTGELACTNVASGTTGTIIFNSTIGNTYYIQLQRRSGGTGLNMSGSICAYQTPPPPPNDDPCSAIALSVNSSCSYNTYTTTSSTTSAGIPAPGCANYLGGDVWFTSVIPSSGKLGINSMSSIITNGGMAVYYGTCNSLTLISCDDASSSNSGDMPFINVSTRPVGSTVYIRFWEYGNDNNGTFQICTSELNACGNDQTNDYCSNPAELTQGSGSWTSSTSSTYTPDRPGNIGSIFCGGTATIENNSWYRFTALNTSESFNFTTITNCLNNKGIQAEVFEVTNDGSSCCTGFSSKSNYYNPGNTTTGTVTATGLTPFHTYILMVDGFAGDQCDFTVSNWTATGILTVLSVQLKSFYGISGKDQNQLFWETTSEKNNDFFILEKSTNGIDFEEIGHINGNGNSKTKNNYSFEDPTASRATSYYRLNQVDFDGKKQRFDIITLSYETNKIGILNIYPNPTKNTLYVDVNTENSDDEDIEILNEVGNLVQTEHIYTHNTATIPINIQNLQNGLYFIHLRNSQNQSNAMSRFAIR